MDSQAIIDLSQRIIADYAVEPLLILFVGIFAAKLLEAILLFGLRELRLRGEAWRFAAYTITVLASIATVCVALASVGILSIVAWTLLGIVILVIVLSFLLSLKDFFPNIAAYPAAKRAHKNGASIKTAFGVVTVISVQLLDTHVRTKEGDDLYIPNRSIANI
jgi:hypothetical protein